MNASLSDFGEIKLERDLKRERDAHKYVLDDFYAGSTWNRLKRRLGFKTYPPLRNITIWNAYRNGERLFTSVDINDGRNDQLQVRTNLIGEPTRFIDTKRWLQIVEFPNGESTTFPSYRALANFCADATNFPDITKVIIDNWIERYESELLSRRREERICALAVKLIGQWDRFFMESKAVAIEGIAEDAHAMNDGEQLSMRALIPVLIVIAHSDYGEAEELAKAEISSIFQAVSDAKSEEGQVAYFATCLNYMRAINDRPDRIPYIEYLARWLAPKKIVMGRGHQQELLTDASREEVLAYSRKAINAGYNFE